MSYVVNLSDNASADFDNYIDYIIYECDAPLTAAKHKAGIIDILLGLEKNPFIYPIRYSRSLTQYGFNVRRANFKKMAILYTIYNDVVFVHRIVAGSMITGV